MFNYTEIADDDPGGDLVAATTTLQAMTKEVTHDQYRADERTLIHHLGFATASTFIVTIEGLVASKALPGVTLRLLQSEGIDVADQDTIDTLNDLVTNAQLDANLRDQVLGLKTEQVTKYPGIQVAHVQKARTMRAENRA